MYTSLFHDTQMICSNFCLLSVCLTYYFLAENTQHFSVEHFTSYFYPVLDKKSFISAFSRAWGWINLWNSTLEVWKVVATEPWPDILVYSWIGEKQSDVVYTRARLTQGSRFFRDIFQAQAREYACLAWLLPRIHYPHIYFQTSPTNKYCTLLLGEEHPTPYISK